MTTHVDSKQTLEKRLPANQPNPTNSSDYHPIESQMNRYYSLVYILSYLKLQRGKEK